MPELPEAETIVRGLRPSVTGRTIVRARVPRPDVLRAPRAAFQRLVRGRRFESIGRRGKNVVFRLDDDGVIAVNLGMTGRLLPFEARPSKDTRPTHPAVLFELDAGRLLVFDDVRRFGTVEYLDDASWRERSARMGPEPFASDFEARDLAAALSTSRSPARSWLLDQRRIAGVGNIYACEALFLAGIHPQTPARDIGSERAGRLHGAIRSVLREAIAAGGTTIRDYRNASGEEGRFARRLEVYGREGEPCVRCGTTVERFVFGNRSAYACPTCQPATA